jgi:choline dehydrogenase
MSDTHDYIIVGAGSAGCVLAARLTEDAGTRVLLLEFGGSDRSVFIQMPSAFSIPMNGSKYNWRYHTAPEPGLDGRRVHCPRGKVLGGSSSINGLVYMRGHPLDFDEWEELGARGWGYRNCLPYFRKAETFAGGGDEYRGGDGPLHVTSGNGMENPLYRAFVDAGHEAGYGRTDDPNGHMQEGFGPMHVTIRNGVRWSTANAYLKPAMSRPNLNVLTHALSRRVLVENGRAVGVEYAHGGKVETARCTREVIVAAGAIGSPHLLQRSGIGPAGVLKAAGIDVLKDVPGIGENLQDHS